MTERKNKPGIAVVFGVQGCIVTGITSSAVSMHEVIFIHLDDYEKKRGMRRLRAEVIRVFGDKFDAQVFAGTYDIRVGQTIELSREFLAIELGPGLLGNVFDGLMNPLAKVLTVDGPVLRRGTHVETIDKEQSFIFKPAAKIGDTVHRGQTLGVVREGAIHHRIVLPFSLSGKFQVVAMATEKTVSAHEVVACVSHNETNTTHDITLSQMWPIRKPIAGLAERVSPHTSLSTKIRAVDVMLPIVKGSSACVVGRRSSKASDFVRHLARNVDADVVIVAICGERASSVTYLIDELNDPDPKTSRSLMSRTIIISNSAAQPIASREISLCAAVVVGEYYQNMGLNVVVIMDGVSRFAETAREIGGIIDEKLDDNAFPMDVRSRITRLYERASILGNDQQGSAPCGALTIIGTAQFDEGASEPLLSATSSAVNCFLQLDDAAEQIVPTIALHRSWSRFADVAQASFDERFFQGAYAQVQRLQKFVEEGRMILNKIAIVGEEDISLSAYVHALKTQLFEKVFLEQDFLNAYDRAPSDTRMASQFKHLLAIIDYTFLFGNKGEARRTFLHLTALLNDLNRMNTHLACFDERLKEVSDLIISCSLPLKIEPAPVLVRSHV